MSLYIIEDDDGNVLTNDCDFDNTTVRAALYDEPLEPYSDAKKYGGHVVKLNEEQKVKLPREVCEELDQFATRYLDVLQFAYDLYALSAMEFPALVNWMCSAERRWVIIDAYRYGWAVEKPKRWNVKVPGEFPGGERHYWKTGVDRDVETAKLISTDSRFKFTLAEIEHYGLQDCEKKEVTDDDD